MDWYNRWGYPRDIQNVADLEDWRTPGPYTGMGPTDFTGTDEWITDQINQRLMIHGYLDARDINVSVEDGIVTLTGSVDSRKAKRMAEDTVDSVLGVIDVNNELRIEHKEQQEQHGPEAQQSRAPHRYQHHQGQNPQQRRNLNGQRAPWERY